MRTQRHRRARGGAYWIEGMMILAASVVAILIWLPASKAATLAQAERGAIETMRRCAPHLGGAKDLRELVAALPAGAEKAGFSFLTEDLAERDGYLFRLTPKENGFVLYAWPLSYGETGNAAFLLDPPRPLLETRNHRRHYSGAARPPQDKAGFPAGKDDSSSAFGKDAQEWKPVAAE